MEKGKRILAIIGIILLVALYGLTLFAAFFDNTDTMRYLTASIAATVVLPVLLWVYQMIYRLLRDRRDGFGQEEMSRREKQAFPFLTRPMPAPQGQSYSFAPPFSDAESSVPSSLTSASKSEAVFFVML